MINTQFPNLTVSQKTLSRKLHQCASIKRKIVKFISYDLIKHFQIIKRKVSFI